MPCLCAGRNASTAPRTPTESRWRLGSTQLVSLCWGVSTERLTSAKRTVLKGLERAEVLRDEGSGRDVLLMVDAPPTGELPLEAVRARLGQRAVGSITLLVFDLLLPNTGYARAAVNDAEWDVQLAFDRELARRTIFPAVDIRRSWSRLLADGRVGREHAAVAAEVRAMLDAGKALATRTERATWFQSQPFFVAEPWTGRPGAYVPLEAALAGYRAIVQGSTDILSERDLQWMGTLPGPQ